MSALAVLPSVPIAAVGTWQTSTGEWVCTPEQLRSAVAAEASGTFRSPVIKIGHDDPRWNDGQPCGDGEPAVGRLENLRVTDAGQTLVADLVGVPAWLADIMASAYPSRSIECYLDLTGDDGTVWPMVVTGLALLGVQAPAIESLGDIADLYGVSRQVEDYVTATARRVAASALPEEAPMPRALGQIVDTPARMVTGSAMIEELCAAAERWAAAQPMLGQYAYCRDMLTDAVVFSTWSGDEQMFWRASWTETGGVFTFGTPERVRPTYEPVPATPADAGAMAASQWVAAGTRERVLRTVTTSAVPSPRGRVVAAGQQGEHVPLSPALAAALGIGEDADDETALAALDKLRTPAGPPSTDPAQEPAAPVDVEQLVAAALARELPKATAPILASLQTTSTELAAMKAKEADSVKSAVIASAVQAGKITPADKAKWEANYDEAPAVITNVLASLAPGTAVPVTATGHAGGEISDLSAEDEALWASLYGAPAGGNV